MPSTPSCRPGSPPGTRRRGRCRDPGPGHGRGPRPPGPPGRPVHGDGRGQAPAPARSWPSQLGADTVVPPDQLARAVRRRSGSLVLAGRLTDGADVVFDCVGLLRVAHPVAGHGPTPGPGRARRHARQGLGRPGAAVAPRADPGRRLRLRHRAPPRRAPSRAAPSTWPSTWWRRPGWARWCPPRTRSSATRRPSPTPVRPAAGVR